MTECQIDFTGMTGIARKKKAMKTIATYEIHSRMLSLTSRTTEPPVRGEISHSRPQAVARIAMPTVTPAARTQTGVSQIVRLPMLLQTRELLGINRRWNT